VDWTGVAISTKFLGEKREKYFIPKTFT